MEVSGWEIPRLPSLPWLPGEPLCGESPASRPTAWGILCHYVITQPDTPLMQTPLTLDNSDVTGVRSQILADARELLCYAYICQLFEYPVPSIAVPISDYVC